MSRLICSFHLQLMDTGVAGVNGKDVKLPVEAALRFGHVHVRTPHQQTAASLVSIQPQVLTFNHATQILAQVSNHLNILNVWVNLHAIVVC